MAVAGHNESENLPEDEAYDKQSLQEHIDRQPEVSSLCEKHRFISFGFFYRKETLHFNKEQRKLIKAWIGHK